jgi:hypothetical protein
MKSEYQWTALTMVGFVAGLVLSLTAGVPIFAVLGAMAGTPIVLGLVGAGVGTAQWGVVRRHIVDAKWWPVASAVGMAVGLSAGVTLVEQIGRAIVGGPLNFRQLGVWTRAASFGTIGLLGGAALGFAQWIVLRRQIAGCARWIAANAWSLGVGLAGGSLLADATGRRAGSLLSTSILLLVGTAVAGLWTARVLSQIMAAAPQPSRART